MKNPILLFSLLFFFVIIQISAQDTLTLKNKQFLSIEDSTKNIHNQGKDKMDAQSDLLQISNGGQKVETKNEIKSSEKDIFINFQNKLNIKNGEKTFHSLNVSDKVGIVVLIVCVNAEGNVISADYTPNGSTTSDKDLIDSATKNAFRYIFAKGKREKQCGTITYNFKKN